MTGRLDINSERGRIAAEDQMHAAEIVCAGTDCQFFHTGDHGPAKVDGVVVRKGFIVAVAEIKTREVAYEELMGVWNGEWLLTQEKLADIALASELLAVTGIGMLYLPNSACVLVVKLTNAEGSYLCKFRTASTQTQQTCNGGKVTRDNAFIDVRNARIYRDLL